MNKEKLVQEVLDVLNQMEKVSFPVCHVSESIIKPIQKKLDNGEISKENLEIELNKYFKRTQEAIEEYTLGILKIIKQNELNEDFLHEEYKIAFSLAIQKKMFKE